MENGKGPDIEPVCEDDLTAATELPDPWERRPGESAKAFAAFQRYLTMDARDRSVLKVSQKCAVHRNLIARWSSRFAWVQRVKEFDDHLQEVTLEKIQKSRISLGLQQVTIAEKMLALVEANVARLAKRKRIGAQDTARMFAVCSRVLAQAFGDEPLVKAAIPKVVIRLAKNCPRDFAAEAEARGEVPDTIH